MLTHPHTHNGHYRQCGESPGLHCPHTSPLAAALAATAGPESCAGRAVLGGGDGGAGLLTAGSLVLLAAGSGQVPARDQAQNSL